MDIIYCNIFEEFTDSKNNPKDHKRIYLIVNKFLKDNLKRKTGDGRRIASLCLFNGSIKLPAKFHLDFLKKNWFNVKESRLELPPCL